MEIEAKFAVQDVQVYRSLQATDHLGRFAVSRGHVKTFIDTYWDTEDRRVLDAGYACRIREYADEAVATVKELFILGDNNIVHRREEFEVHLSPTTMREQPEQWPESHIRQLLLGLTKRAPLVPLFGFAQHRVLRNVWRDQHKVAELCLDTVTLSQQDQVYLEVEVELAPDGTEAELAEIVAALAQTPGLIPEPRSKFERGLALPLANSASTAKGKGPGITLDDTLAGALLKTLRYHYRQMVNSEPGTRIGEDIKALHDMRVAARRMRTAFRVFADYIDADEAAPYLISLKRTGRVLGVVRDMDVFREKAETYLETLPENARPDLTLLKAAWDAEYALARRQMLKYLDSDKYTRFKAQFKTYLDTKPKKSNTPRVRDVIGRLIQEQAGALRTCKSQIDEPECTLAEYHELRIAAKHLRYMLEYFREVLTPSGERAIEDVKLLQNHLGALQDAVVASLHVRYVVAYGTWRLPEEKHLRWLVNPTRTLDIRDYLDYQVEEIDRLMRTFPEVWDRYQSPSFKQLISNAVIALPSK